MTMERDSLVARLRECHRTKSLPDAGDWAILEEAAAALSRPEQVVKALEEGMAFIEMYGPSQLAERMRASLSALHPAPEAASVGAAVTCATEGCEQPATCRFERKGVGSVYCGECFGRIVEAVDRPSDTAPSPKGVSDGVREAAKKLLDSLWFSVRSGALSHEENRAKYEREFPAAKALEAALSQEPVPATAEERAASKEGA